MSTPTVLISGASIAGPALAFWLHQRGLHPIVIERFDGLRPGGQSIDLRGAGQTVAQRMGIEAAVKAAGTGEKGVAFIDRDNRTRAAFASAAADGQGFTAELEILRGDLAQLLYDRTRDDVDYVFGDQITGLIERGERVHVELLHGEPLDVDLVIAADGLRSRTRTLVFGDETELRPLGQYTAYFTIPREATDTDWARWYNAPGGRVITLRPDNEGTTRVLLTFGSEPRGYEDLSLEEQKQLMVDRFADAGWEAARVVAALPDAPDFYFELIGQVRTPRWSRGRVGLLGDAAWCASPISGMGTSLAMVGAYVLGGELARHDDHRDAFAAYEKVMRPYVDQAQHLPPGTPRVATPNTRAGIAVLNTVLRVASSPLAGRLGRAFQKPPADKIDLPTYE